MDAGGIGHLGLGVLLAMGLIVVAIVRLVRAEVGFFRLYRRVTGEDLRMPHERTDLLGRPDLTFRYGFFFTRRGLEILSRQQPHHDLERARRRVVTSLAILLGAAMLFPFLVVGFALL